MVALPACFVTLRILMKRLIPLLPPKCWISKKTPKKNAHYLKCSLSLYLIAYRLPRREWTNLAETVASSLSNECQVQYTAFSYLYVF